MYPEMRWPGTTGNRKAANLIAGAGDRAYLCKPPIPVCYPSHAPPIYNGNHAGARLDIIHHLYRARWTRRFDQI
jgi:hypothetical protein